MVLKAKIRAKKALDTVDKKKGQKLSFRSVDSNKLTKIRPKKRKSEPKNKQWIQ